MNFYKLIKQQYNNYKINEECEFCPCKTLRNKIFGTRNLRQKCSSEIKALMFVCYKHGYNIGIFNTYLCEECRLASLKIAKALFREKEINKI